MATYKNLTPIVYTTIANEGVLDDILAAPDVDFAYPTTRFFDNVGEGKPATRAMAPD